MVRHEAGEALGALGDASVVDLLAKYAEDPVIEVAETCQLALQRLKWSLNGGTQEESAIYDSIDPTPAAESVNVKELGAELVDSTKPLWERYRAMFKLRNINTDESIKALAQGKTTTLT